MIPVFVLNSTQKNKPMNVWFTTTDLHCAGFIHHFEKTNTNDFILQIIPCMGLNRRYGEIINETFIIGKLLDALKAFNF
jgi:hypothetical protein